LAPPPLAPGAHPDVRWFGGPSGAAYAVTFRRGGRGTAPGFSPSASPAALPAVPVADARAGKGDGAAGSLTVAPLTLLVRVDIDAKDGSLKSLYHQPGDVRAGRGEVGGALRM